MIDVMQEQVERRDTLDQASLNLFPFACGNNSRQQIEWEYFFRPGGIAIDVERDALAQKGEVHRLALVLKLLFRQGLEQFPELLVMGPDLPAAIHHLIKKTIVPVIFEQPFCRLRFALAGHFATLIPGSTTAWIFLRFKNPMQIEGFLRHRGHNRCCLLSLHNSIAVLAIVLPPQEKSLAET